MTPIIGILASSMTAGQLGSFESIATTTLTGNASSISFTNISSSYQHLQIRGFAKTDRSSTSGDYMELRFNDDSGSTYRSHYLGGNGSSATSGDQGAASVIYVERIPCTTQTNIFGGFVLDILDYKNTNKFSTARWLCGYDINGDPLTTNIQLGSGLWRDTSAITKIEFFPGVGSNFTQYSTIALYGIKG